MNNPEPQVMHIERELIARILMFRYEIPDVSGRLKPKMFYDRVSGVAYEAIIEADSLGMDPYGPALIDLVRRRHGDGMADAVDGLLYELGADVVSPTADAATLGEIIVDTAGRRELYRAAGRIATGAIKPDAVLEDVFALLRTSIEDVSEYLGNVGRSRGAREFSGDFIDTMMAIGRGEYSPRIPTGIPGLDNLMWGGWARGMMHTLFGRSSVGKSLVAAYSALQCAIRGHSVLYFSLEMSAEEVMERWVSSLIGVPIKLVPKLMTGYDQPLTGPHRALIERSSLYATTGRMPNTMQEAIMMASGYISALPIVIDDHPMHTADSIHAAVLARPVLPEVVFVDHILQLKVPKGGQTASSVGDDFNMMLAIARDTNVAMIVVSQANRAVESREEKELWQADMHQAGEKPSNVIIGLSRTEKPDGSPIADLIVNVSKNRGGPTGKFNIRVNLSTSTILGTVETGEIDRGF